MMMRFISSRAGFALFLAALLVIAFGLFGAALHMAVSAATAAETATVGSPTIAQALQPIVEMIVVTLVAAALGWLTPRLQTLLGVSIEARHRDALHSALATAANLLISKAATTGAAHLADGLDHVMIGAGDAVRRFGIDRPRLKVMLEATVQRVDPSGAVKVEGDAVVAASPLPPQPL